jgi:hypothetical protein
MSFRRAKIAIADGGCGRCLSDAGRNCALRIHSATPVCPACQELEPRSRLTFLCGPRAEQNETRVIQNAEPRRVPARYALDRAPPEPPPVSAMDALLGWPS